MAHEPHLPGDELILTYILILIRIGEKLMGEVVKEHLKCHRYFITVVISRSGYMMHLLGTIFKEVAVSPHLAKLKGEKKLKKRREEQHIVAF